MAPFLNLAVQTFDPQNALSLARASELSYHNESDIKSKTEQWGFSQSQFFQNQKSDKEAFIAANDEAVMVVFRGTNIDQIKDWLSDASFFPDTGPWGKAHDGFQYALSSVWPGMKAFLMPFLGSGRKFFIAGHSLGGAMAVLAAADLIKEGESVHNLYTFGQPKAGNGVFARAMNKRAKPYYFRLVNHNDIVPRILPSMIFDYQHAGQKYYIDGNGNLHKNPFCQWEFLDQWRYKLTPEQILKEDFGDHAMTEYIAKLQQANIENSGR